MRTFVGFGDFARGYLRFARFSTLMSANWPLMCVNVFFVGYGTPHVRQWFSHSVAVEMVVNGVLRTLWVNIPHRVRFMDVRFKTAPKGMLAFRRVRKRAV